MAGGGIPKTIVLLCAHEFQAYFKENYPCMDFWGHLLHMICLEIREGIVIRTNEQENQMGMARVDLETRVPAD